MPESFLSWSRIPILGASFLGAFSFGLSPALAQKGDRGDASASMRLPADFKVPPSPVVPPERSLETFVLKPGFRIELVAAEPLVNRPVDIAWDADGRLWVAEMTRYMPDVDATGEREPLGTIAVLEDTDGDSIMDKRTVFLDGLVLPRTVAPAAGGVLVGAPPSLLFCRDTNGDLVCDEKVVVDAYYGSVNGNVEHMTNVLRPQRDNWFLLGKDERQYRFRNGAWETGRGKGLGQWGLAPDDWGRVYYNSNSNLLSVDGSRLASNQVWPVRPTPGVNRGYQWIAKSDRLHSVTAACGPGVYRGGAFPEEFEGNVFVCAPCVNVVSRLIVSEESDGSIRGEHAYRDSDFLASTDERFRPVNVLTGPDGGLYVVDMYHGILQHKTYVTSWLRQQILDRGLDKPMGTGRIYRILPEGAKPGPRPALGTATTAELVSTLAHPNGWWRDTAQRLLVEGAKREAVPALRETLARHNDPRARFHALWTLEGLAAADEQTLTVALSDRHPKVREAGMRIAIDSGAGEALAAKVVPLLEDADAFVASRTVEKLAAAGTPALAAAFAEVLSTTRSETVLKSAAAAAEGREIEVLRKPMGDPNWNGEAGIRGRERFLRTLAERIVDRGHAAECDQLVALIDGADAADWRPSALLRGALSSRRAKDRKMKPVRLSSTPRFTAPMDEKDAKALREVFVWPGEPGYVLGAAKEFKLDAAQVAQLSEGKTLYNVICAVCHKADGTGQEGLAPPLADSEWVGGTYSHLLRITLHGLSGPIEVEGRKYRLEMPPLGALPDAQLAAVLSYVQREFGDATLPPLEAAEVGAERNAWKDRTTTWSAKELEAATPR
jgi:mono/diheme cytochrome c family protein/glucose/arabinose dehydrogenase